MRALIVMLLLTALACEPYDSGSSLVAAPASIDGHVYNGVVKEATLLWSDCGGFIISFTGVDYQIIGDGECVDSSTGTYTYDASVPDDPGAGVLILSDASDPLARLYTRLFFHEPSSGHYVISGRNGWQKGTFDRLQ